MTQIKEDEVIQRAVKKAIKDFNDSLKMEQKQKVLHNTKLLMKHYNSLKAHAEKAVYNIDAINEIYEKDDEDDRAYIASIKRSKLRTLIMVSHIDQALKELKEKKTKENMIEHYKALKMYYIDKKTYEEIQKELICSKNTPARWINAAIRDLSVLLFGVDGLKINDMV